MRLLLDFLERYIKERASAHRQFALRLAESDGPLGSGAAKSSSAKRCMIARFPPRVLPPRAGPAPRSSDGG
jgi:hypothetical protein